MAMSIKILETGTVRIRPNHRQQSAHRPVWLRRLHVALDRAWTPPLPINTYLIEHPEGYILFDSGESPHSMKPGFFPSWMPFFHRAVSLHVREQEGIGARLKEHNVEPSGLKAVILSHLHHDHGDGIPDLTGSPIFVTQEHWDAFKSPLHATMEGAVPGQWPPNFKPDILQPTGGPIGPWNRSYPITQDGKIVAVDTPGHVPGHVSVIVFGDNINYILLGDATYEQELLDRELTDGVNSNPLLAIQSIRKVKEFAQQAPVVLLPAHDPGAALRLENKVVYKPSNISEQDYSPSGVTFGHVFALILLLLGLFGIRLRTRS